MECVWSVVDSWFTASSGPSQSNHGTQDKPAINTHTQERPLSWQHITSASPINAYFNSTSTWVLGRRAPAGSNCLTFVKSCKPLSYRSCKPISCPIMRQPIDDLHGYVWNGGLYRPWSDLILFSIGLNILINAMWFNDTNAVPVPVHTSINQC